MRAARADEHARCKQAFAAHHYLREAQVVGDRGWQIAECARRWVAVILWCAAATPPQSQAPQGPRNLDPVDPHTRAERLKRVVQQARFCFLHAQLNLVSWVLGDASATCRTGCNNNTDTPRCPPRPWSIPSRFFVRGPCR